MPRRPKHRTLTKKEIGQRLRVLRTERGMTQLELADAMGIHETSLSQMDRGIRGVGTKQIIRDLQGAQGLAGRVGQPLSAAQA